MNWKKVINPLKITLFSASLVLIFSQCSREDELLPTTKEPTALSSPAAQTDAPPVASLTIDGINTVLASTLDCKTCSYIVPVAASIIDGKALGIKPGQAICLDNAIKYGNLTFINLEGEENNPITIAYGVETFSDIAGDSEDWDPTEMEME